MHRLLRILRLIKFGLEVYFLPVEKYKSSDLEDRRFRWAIIGTGYMATTFSKSLRANRSASIIAVSSRDYLLGSIFAFALPEAKAFKGHKNLLDVLSKEIDVVYVATPAQTHFQIIMDSLEANCNVLCEKPVCTSSKEILIIKQIAEEKRLFVMEGLWTNLLPTMKKAKELLLKNKIGPLKLITITNEKMSDEKKDLDVKSMLLDYGIYSLAFIKFFYGDIIDLKVVEFINRPGLAKITFVNDSDGVEISGVISAGVKRSSTAKLIGPNGEIVWGFPFNRANIIKHLDYSTGETSVFKFSYTREGFEYMVQHVHYCLGSSLNESPIIPIHFSSDIMRTIERFLK